MMTGERRWASARRGGMTVLGKVAVPKPINLPSQKLENHGLDPNVEIVPKGTVSWGSRSFSSASNPWGSSTQSPKADGSSGSPSHLSGRPSSGGSGTRPSTGSSDRAHEPIANSWSSDSRPSSASGVLTSNQILAASLRPRSAETRPGSSQLSRFAEQLSENSGAWDTAGAEGKLGVTSFKNDGFALASRDFPTLGSEKDNGRKNMESQDLGSHDRLSSSSGVAPVKDRMGISVAGDVSVNADLKNETANTWRRDNNLYGEDGVKPSLEKWQADTQGPHPFPNVGIPHQHYETWHGPPQINNHPGGIWYRGPPGGPPFASPVLPGGFPMEPFHFYRPQIPSTSLANPQPVPPPAAGPRAHHPKNGDMYRPPMPDAYMRPGMPMRPGFYPGPVAYEGYYGPPMGYHNSNERDIPFMGMAAGPHSYNRYSGQSNHDAGNSYSRSCARGPNGKALASEQVEPGHSHDAQGPYRVLLKQQDGWEGKDREQKWKETATANASHVEKGDQQKLSSWENDWREDYKKDELMGLNRKGSGEEVSYQVSDHEGGSSSVPVKVKSSESMGNAKVVDDLSVKAELAATAYPEIPAAPKDSSLIQKIDGLNAKACTSDGRHNLIMSVSSREAQKNTSQFVIADSDEATTGSVHVGKNQVTGTNNEAAYEESVAAGDKSFKPTAASGRVISRRSMHGVHSRTDHRGKGRFSSQEVDGWRRKSPVAVASTDLSAAHSENSNIPIQGYPVKEITEKSEFYTLGNDGGSPLAMLEPSDNQAQVYDGSGASKQKRLSCNRKQNIPSEKNPSEQIIATSTTEPLKGLTDLIVNAAAACEITDNQISPICESNTPVPNIMAESSIQQRRRNKRGAKKHRVEEASSGTTLPFMVSTETDIMTNTSDDSGKTKASESELDACSVQPPTDSKDASQSSELHSYSPSEENHVRANNQWKSQNSHRMARSAQTNKSVEKFHSNEAVMWAPVRTQNKVEVSNEPSHKSVVEASTVKSDNQMQNNLRNKRAEMERYISKPMAKEIAQQGSGQQQPGPCSIDKTLSDEINVKEDSGSQIMEGSQPAEFASGKKGVVMESKNGDHRQNKQGKVYGPWRQRSSTDSNFVQGLQDAQSSNASRNVQKPVEHERTLKPEVSSEKEQPTYPDTWSSDGWNMPENPESAVPPNVTVAKDQGVTARGKRHQYKGHKGSGNNHDHGHKKTNSGDDDKIYWQSTVPVPETSQKGLPSSKETHATGDRSTSHWQPKIQACVTSNQWGSRPNCGPNVGAEVGRSNIKDSCPQGRLSIPPQPGKEKSEVVAQSHHGHTASVISKVEATSNVGHQESKRERKVASAKGCSDSLNQGPDGLVEIASLSNIDIQNKEHVSPGFRRNGNQNGRFNRHESCGDWSSSGQDNKNHNPPINRERQRHNAHYEYQPVGPCNNDRANNFEGPKDAPNSGGGKYRERGQSHSRRGGGNYHRRSSGTV